ncbi:MAG TPA: glycosyltransferase family 92 protein [Leptolinea sp.]
MYLSLCLIAKDENSYLKEWLDFHILLGVEHFWIYDNDSEIPLEQTIQPYIQKGWVTINHIQGKGMQLYAYDHCIQTYGTLTRWIGFIDTDEFIIPRTGENLPNFLANYEKFGGLALSSLFFGAGGNQIRPMCGQIAGYQIRVPEDLSTNRLIKSIIQPDKVLFPISPHSFMYSEGNYCVNEVGNRVDTQFFPCSVTKIQLNHYYTRSAQEWKEKISRGRGDMGDPYSDKRWENANIHSKVIDDSAIKLTLKFLSLPRAIERNLTALTDSHSSKFLDELSTAAETKNPAMCTAKSYGSIEKRDELSKLIQDFLDGMDFIETRQFQEARNLYSKMLQQFPFDLTQYTNLATACIQLRDFPTAWEALSQAWQMSPKNWTVLLCMVDYFYAIGNFEQVEKCSFLLQGFGNLEPIGVAVLALAQWKMGKHSEAFNSARLLLPQLTPELAASHVWFQEMLEIMKPQK